MVWLTGDNPGTERGPSHSFNCQKFPGPTGRALLKIVSDQRSRAEEGGI